MGPGLGAPALGRTLALVAALAAAPALAQPVDTVAVAPTVEPTAPSADSTGRSPRGAVLRALAVPGWGQLYNRQPLKAPVAAGGVVAAAVYFVDRQRQYRFYRRLALVAGCRASPGGADDPDRQALCADAIAAYGDELDAFNEGRAQPVPLATLQSVRNTARGQRDVGAVVVLAAYAVQALDAYVAAELSTFDVSEDLSIRVGVPVGPGAVSARLRF